jgi:ribosomal protein S18 acetylase RimI-like enzyme
LERSGPIDLVVRLNQDDADDVHRLLKATWRETYPEELPAAVLSAAEDTWHSTDTLRRQMRNATMIFCGRREDGVLTGMARAAMTSTDSARLFQVYVLTEFQRHGIGTRLFSFVKDSLPAAKRFDVDVPRGNRKAEAFFTKLGFQFTGESILRLGDVELHNQSAELLA